MIELPKEKIKASRDNPKKIIIYSHPKVGKTTAISELEDCLLLDVEGGSDFVDAVKIDVIKIAKENKVLPIVTLQNIITEIKKNNENTGKYLYKYIAIDTVSTLEDLVLPLANNLYKNTNMGRNWSGQDVTLLPNGAGYRFTRAALQLVLNSITEVCDTLIILGHVKEKLIELEGKEIPERALDLIGKMGPILCSQVDAIGYMYRDKNKTKVSFIGTSSIICGARSQHLKNTTVTLMYSDEHNNVTVDWTKIFI